MIATSVGQGPFHPAIRWRDRLWVAEVTFADEDKAAQVADEVIGYLDMKAVEYLNGLHYEPKTAFVG